jgi:hypothetical protein
MHQVPLFIIDADKTEKTRVGGFGCHTCASRGDDSRDVAEEKEEEN